MATSSSIYCGGCHQSISSSLRTVFALNDIWHEQCFRCSVCFQPLKENYYSKENELFCQEHFTLRFSQVCQKCNTRITGPVMVAGDVNFHPECFMCTICKKFIGDGDEYTLEERNSLFCGRCYLSRRCRKLEEIQNLIWSRQHTISHLRLEPKQIGEGGISLNIDKVKNTGPKLRQDVLRKVTNGVKKESTDEKSSVISIRGSSCSTSESSPLKAGDKVIEVNGVPVSDETIQEVSKLLRSKPTETLHVTIERHQKELDNKSPIGKSESDPSLVLRSKKSENGFPAMHGLSHDQLRDRSNSKERNLSFFNFSVFKRTKSDGTELKLKAAKARQAKKPLLPNTGTLPKSFGSKARPKLIRSRSLTEINGNDEVTQKDMLKAYTSLHRAQSFKTEESPVSQVFRPSELIPGDLIGKGFFGDVIKVTCSRTGEEMVMKQLKQVNKDAEETFLNEVQLLKSLKHPNVLRFIGIMYKSRSLHILTEFISGGTLRKLLKNKHREISWKQRVQFSKDIASGMAYLHDMNVIHRDLTSKNCLIRNDTDGKTVVVADFGLAKLLPQDATSKSPCLSPTPFLSRTSPSTSPSSSPIPVSPSRPMPKKRLTVVGSPFWMAPEMLSGKGYDEKVDIFSFGIILCEVIGRVKADPDYLPRKFDFGVDEEEFKKQFCSECPEPFFRLAFEACATNPDTRPAFALLEKWLEAIYINLEFKIPLPTEIDYRSMPKPPMYKIEETAVLAPL